MTRKSLTGDEADLLIKLRDACASALRHGLAESTDRLQLNAFAYRIRLMISYMDREP